MEENKIEFRESAGGDLEQRIVEVARRRFIENGYENTSMSDIAAAAGINRTALHYYFRTKERMFHAVFGSIMLSILPRIQVIFDEDIPLGDKFSKVVDIYFRIFSENPSLPLFILGEINRDVDHLLDTGRRLHLDSYLSAIEKIISQEMERGTIKSLPSPVILLTFMSQVTFPFLAGNLVKSLFGQDDAQFAIFLDHWKQNIVSQMNHLLESE
ncbi:TetR/AcrR family transcriptional regulator [Alistipes sp. OttesenSCG-928-B03]|nr:TetR/AcrR family transcriptional regulator [Alistipes sp. OttesenSCG-928-B03]